MKSIVAINTNIPTAEGKFDYFSGSSLRDYDIAIFDPRVPYLDRIKFDGGGSCLDIESMEYLSTAIRHWSSEFSSAVKAGKTIFVLLNEYVEDRGATGSTLNKNQRNYTTTKFNNYQALPISLGLQNTRGEKIVAANGAYRGLLNAVKAIVHYRVVVTSGATDKIFTTRDGATIGAVVKFDDYPGSIVLLPYFDFEAKSFVEEIEGVEMWTESALKTSRVLMGQLAGIDKFLSDAGGRTPPPDWISKESKPHAIAALDDEIAELERTIHDLQAQRSELTDSRASAIEITHLLYETGKPLELAIENALRLIGYEVETLRIDDLEIDHVIVSPEGKRMIGESEGKDNSAVDITKFRQLESNIGEDFERDEVTEPAAGILFGNGYRLKPPGERPDQFTPKSMKNAQRLGVALVCTADLYPVVVHLTDNPDDEAFKAACRAAIEGAAGQIARFTT